MERDIVRRIGIGLTAALFIAAVAAPTLASKPATPNSGLVGDHKVTICHATSSDTNPWLVITVDIASSGGRNKLIGHLEHAKDPNKQGGRGDVIPPFSYPGFDDFLGAGDPGQEGLPQVCDYGDDNNGEA